MGLYGAQNVDWEVLERKLSGITYSFINGEPVCVGEESIIGFRWSLGIIDIKNNYPEENN